MNYTTEYIKTPTETESILLQCHARYPDAFCYQCEELSLADIRKSSDRPRLRSRLASKIARFKPSRLLILEMAEGESIPL